jgi:excisionase family DNA binding protein
MTDSKEQARRWLTVKAAAEHLNCSVHWIRSLLWAGEVPFVRIGKRFIVDRADLDGWATRSKRTAGQR